MAELGWALTRSRVGEKNGKEMVGYVRRKNSSKKFTFIVNKFFCTFVIEENIKDEINMIKEENCKIHNSFVLNNLVNPS